MIAFKRLERLWILLLVTVCGIRLSSAHALGSFGKVDDLVSSMTNSVLHLLENLQNSHGASLSNVLTLLLERVRNFNVTEEEANIIRDAIVFVDDPKAKEILDLVGKIASTLSVDELLMGAFDVYDDLSKTDSGPSDDIPKLGFEGDNRTYVISQLDILIPEEEIEVERQGRVKRKAVKDNELWKRGIIPYYIHMEDFSSIERYLILNAIDHWEHYTCLEFREKRSTDYNWLFIHGGDNGCFSNAGRIGGRQHLVLSDGCKQVPTIIHELGHTIGLYHEHTRTDRDTYVEIMWENIKDISKYNEFAIRPEQHPIEDMVPYDYRSIMHYGTYFWSRRKRDRDVEKLKTIVTKQPEFQDVIGKARWASFDDIKTISLLYKCAEDCKPKKCPDDGFQGKRCKCWCRGSGDNVPVEECDREVPCSPPQIENFGAYQVWQYQTNQQVLEFPEETPSGTMFNVDLVDLRCGDDLTTIQCLDGIWDLTLPICYPESCFIESGWLNIYNVEVEPEPELPDGNILQANITHGSILKLSCISELEREKTLKCDYGNWTEQPQLCPEIGGRCMILNSSTTVFSLDATGRVLQSGDTVKHGDTVQARCDPELTLGMEYEYYDYYETNVTCLDGKLLGELPTCPEPPIPCFDVPHSHMSTYLTFRYNVTCLNGYQLETEMPFFDCDRNGTWLSPVPNCVAKSCTIPPRNVVKGTIKDVNGVILSEGSQVRSGDSVQFQCPRGFVPDNLDLTCNAEQWNTANGKLPVCKEVICPGRPPVQDSSYAPHLPRYRYGDVVRINRCRGNLETVGPSDHRIECLADGSWSASFYCRKFCDGGTVKEVQFANQMIRAKPARSYTHVKNVKRCKQKCIKQKKFLCLSYLYGFDFDRRRWLCQHFKVDPSKNTRLLEPKDTRYVFARTCIE